MAASGLANLDQDQKPTGMPSADTPAPERSEENQISGTIELGTGCSEPPLPQRGLVSLSSGSLVWQTVPNNMDFPAAAAMIRAERTTAGGRQIHVPD